MTRHLSRVLECYCLQVGIYKNCTHTSSFPSLLTISPNSSATVLPSS
jgi:hypothetical protein